MHHDYENNEGERDEIEIETEIEGDDCSPVDSFPNTCILNKFPLLDSMRWCLYLQPKDLWIKQEDTLCEFCVH